MNDEGRGTSSLRIVRGGRFGLKPIISLGAFLPRVLTWGERDAINLLFDLLSFVKFVDRIARKLDTNDTSFHKNTGQIGKRKEIYRKVHKGSARDATRKELRMVRQAHHKFRSGNDER